MHARAQITFEFLIYLAVGTASLSGALYAYSSMDARSAASTSYAQTLDFISAINSNAGYSASSFYAYIPSGICACSLNASAVKCPYGSFNTSVTISFSGDACSHAGKLARISESYESNGTYLIGVS